MSSPVPEGLQRLVSLLLLLGGCWGEVRDGKYFQDLCFRLTGSGVSWPSDEVRDNFTISGRFIPRNVVATGFQGWRDQMFVITPQFRPGIPFTLSKFDIFQRCFPELQPFPSWSLQGGDSFQSLHNAMDIQMDHRDLLWVLDTGNINTLVQPTKVGPPKVLAFEALTGKVVHTIDLSLLTCDGSRLQTILVDYSRQTGTPWLYIADTAARTIIVYNVADSKGQRVVLPEVVCKDGPRDVLYMTLIKVFNRPERVYFTYLSSKRMFSIKTLDLKYSSNNGTVMDEGTKPASLVLLGSVNENIFFRYKGKPEILMWNINSTFKEKNFIPVDAGEEGRLATQVAKGYGGMLWVMEGNYQDYLRDSTGCLGASVVLHPLVRP